MRFRPAFLTHLTCILTALCDVLAGRAELAEDAAQLRLVMRWVRRVQERAENLIERLARGEDLSAQPPPRKEVWARWESTDEPPEDASPEDASPKDAPPEDGKPEEKPAELRRKRPSLPLQWGWLVRETTQTLPFGTDLLYLLIKDEEIQAFLRAAPEIVPAMRHLLRLLAICPPDFLARPRRGSTRRERAWEPRPKRPPRIQPARRAPPPVTGASFFPPLTLDLLNRPQKAA